MFNVQVFTAGDRIAIIGDGKLGLLVAQLTAIYAMSHGCPPPLHIGKHQSKMELVTGTNRYQLPPDGTLDDNLKQVIIQALLHIVSNILLKRYLASFRSEDEVWLLDSKLSAWETQVIHLMLNTKSC